MRFESLNDLFNFIEKLSTLTGLTASLKDYKADMKKKGMINHIHTYPCYLEVNPLGKGEISFYDNTNGVVPKYVIPLENIKEMKIK